MGPSVSTRCSLRTRFCTKGKKKGQSNIDSLCELVCNYTETWDQRDGHTQQNRWTDIRVKVGRRPRRRSRVHSTALLLEVLVFSDVRPCGERCVQWQTGRLKCLLEENWKEGCDQQIRHSSSWVFHASAFLALGKMLGEKEAKESTWVSGPVTVLQDHLCPEVESSFLTGWKWSQQGFF